MSKKATSKIKINASNILGIFLVFIMVIVTILGVFACVVIGPKIMALLVVGGGSLFIYGFISMFIINQLPARKGNGHVG